MNLPVSRMIDNCSNFIDIMAAEAETMALLEALICADTRSRRIHSLLHYKEDPVFNNGRYAQHQPLYLPHKIAFQFTSITND